MLEHALVPNAGNAHSTDSPPSSGKSQGSTLDTSDRFPKPGDALLEWLTRGATFRSLGLAHNQIWIRGFGPWSNDDLANFLSLRGFNVINVPTPTVSVLVLGRSDYGEDTLFEIIAETCAGPLYIFSQEMLLAWMVSKRDPYIEATEEERAAFATGHPALEYLLYQFGWPRVPAVMPGSTTSPRLLEASVDQSPLGALGYTVGRSGLASRERRKLLDRAFKRALPVVHGPEYMARWGMPYSPQRLERIATHIAWLITTQGTGRKALAGKHWRADLDWLEQQFYDGSFRWPAVTT